MKTLVIIILSVLFLGNTGSAKEQLNINKLELNYPIPAIPFYHFRADLQLPFESIIEVVKMVAIYYYSTQEHLHHLRATIFDPANL